MPNINDLFPSRFLKAHDLKGKTPTVTIARFAIEQLRKRTGTGTEAKGILYFAGKEKGLILNVTNARAVTAIAGSGHTEQWIGVPVQLRTESVLVDKVRHDAIRIAPPALIAAPPAPVASPRPPTTPPRPRPTVPAIFTEPLEIDQADGGRR